MTRKSARATATFERASRMAATQPYVMSLYVTGMTTRAIRAVENVRAMCDEHLEGRYELSVIDVYQQPILAKEEQIIAAPTLIKKLPLPQCRIIGDMSGRDRILLRLGIVRPRGNGK